MEHKQYNGWYNYETWLVNLWLGNEQHTENAISDYVKENKLRDLEDDSYTEDVLTLADWLEEFVDKMNPLGSDASMFSDLLGAALSEVNWREIASHYIEDYREPIKEHREYVYGYSYSKIWKFDIDEIDGEFYDLGDSFWDLFNAVVEDAIEQETKSITISWSFDEYDIERAAQLKADSESDSLIAKQASRSVKVDHLETDTPTITLDQKIKNISTISGRKYGVCIDCLGKGTDNEGDCPHCGGKGCRPY